MPKLRKKHSFDKKRVIAPPGTCPGDVVIAINTNLGIDKNVITYKMIMESKI